MARVPYVKRDELDAEGQEIYDRIRLDRNRPEVGLQYQALLHNPKATGYLASLGAQLSTHSTMPENLKELAIILVAREWNSAIEWTGHAPLATRAGVSPASVVVWMFSISVMLLGTGVVSSQAYPNKPIRIVTSEVGGGSDLAARIIAQEISGPLGQPVIVENRGGIIITSAQIVARARPDGYSLYYNGGNVWLLPFMQDNVPYDPVKDFSPIALTVRAPVVLVVHPSFQANSIKELIGLAKARPGELNYASGVSGSSGHLAMEFFKVRAGVSIVRIAYSGTGPALNAVIAGEAPVQFASGGSAVPHVKSGRLRALAVASAEPSDLLPGLATVAASGLPGFSIEQRQGIWAPTGTPTTVIMRLNQEIVRVLNRAEVKERFRNTGTEIVGSSPQEFAATIKLDMDGLGKVIKTLGIRSD